MHCTLKEGSWFGEISLIKKIGRTASVRTITVCELFRLESSCFDEIMQLYPEFANSISAAVEVRLQEAEKKQTEYLNPRNRMETRRGTVYAGARRHTKDGDSHQYSPFIPASSLEEEARIRSAQKHGWLPSEIRSFHPSSSSDSPLRRGTTSLLTRKLGSPQGSPQEPKSPTTNS